MSDVTISSVDRKRWQLCSAVLVYEGAGTHSVYATVHPVQHVGREWRLGDGAPATKEACAKLARSLGAAATLSGFTPENLLYLGARSILWWRPPSSARVFFNTTKSAAADQPKDETGAALLGKCNGVTPQPGLVFGVTAGRWFVYALKDAARPGPATALLRAPYFNVWANGQICTGNVRLPDTLGPSALERYERAFFDSEFTHPNVHGKARLTNYQKGSYAFWRAMLDLRQTNFPVELLVDVKLTLEGLAKRLEKDDE